MLDGLRAAASDSLRVYCTACANLTAARRARVRRGRSRSALQTQFTFRGQHFLDPSQIVQQPVADKTQEVKSELVWLWI